MSEQKKFSLSDLPKKDPFKTPEGYLDNLDERLERRITKGKGKTRTLDVNWKTMAYAAAASFTLVLLVLFGREKFTTPAPEDMLAAVSTADFVTYLKNSDLEIEELLESDLSGLYDAHTDSLFMDEQLDENKALDDFLLDEYGIDADADAGVN